MHVHEYKKKSQHVYIKINLRSVTKSDAKISPTALI